jgi:hypothetical protein
LVLAAVLVKSADGEHGLLRPLLEFAVLITSLRSIPHFERCQHAVAADGQWLI